MDVDRVLLDALFRGRLVELRERAEEAGLSKSGSVEVLRARLIQNQVLGDVDLSWDSIQSMSHKDIGGVLKLFGVKSSGSHKERRQRLWLHLNFDSRRLTVERLAEMERDELHELCQRLELPLTGNRTVLMGHVAGVLTSQANGWGRIKRSLWRSGLPEVFEVEAVAAEDDSEMVEVEQDDAVVDLEPEFEVPSSNAVLEDAGDALIHELDKVGPSVQGDLLTIQARVEDLERMIGTILRGHGGRWGNEEEALLIRLAERRGWPLERDEVRSRVISVATNIAEIKGAEIGDGPQQRVDSVEALDRVRERMRYAETLISESNEE